MSASTWQPSGSSVCSVMIEWLYEVGQPVLAGGEKGVIERRSMNINHIAVYLVNDRWWFERELSLPCPV